MKNKPTDIVIVLLAAGKSSRFGKPKQLLKWKESNLLQYAIDIAKDSIATHVKLVLGANYDLILQSINVDSVEVIRNVSWKKGLGSSVAFGVKSMVRNYPEADGVLVMLADQPLINSEYLNKIIASFNSNRKQIITSTYDNKKQGVPALFDSCYFKELIELNDDEGAKHLIKRHSAHVKTVKHDIENLDIDTFEDYESLYHANHQ